MIFFCLSPIWADACTSYRSGRIGTALQPNYIFSLAVVAVIIGASVWASLRKEARAGKG